MARDMQTAVIPEHTTVLIVGGGPTGLVMSSLLSGYGINNTVIERQPVQPVDPRAHVVRKRPMEILSGLGLLDEINSAKPSLPMKYINWCSTLAGEEAGKIDLLRGAEEIIEGYPWTNIPQNYLQPILYNKAVSEPTAQVLMGANVTSAQESGDRIDVHVSLESDGSQHLVTTDWLVVADGAGSRTRDCLGIPMEGRGPGGTFFMVHFKANIAEWVDPRPGPLYWILNPEAPGTIIAHDPEKFGVYMTPEFGLENEEDGLIARFHQAVGKSVPTEVVSIRKWVAHGQIARAYRKGRAFLVGDAAHRFPPTGGLGLNTGLLEANNLAWKLAYVIRGLAEDALLDTYEPECKPAAVANTKTSLDNQARLREIADALGSFESPGQLEERIREIKQSGDCSLDDAIENQRSHFTFDGTLPGSVWAGDHFSAYALSNACNGFCLYVDDEQAVADLNDTLSSLCRINVMVCPMPQLTDRDERLTWLTSQKAVLCRPDGIIEWSSDQDLSGQVELVAERISQMLSGKY